MARFIPNPALEVDAAQKWLRPLVPRLTNIAQEGAKRAAPAVGVWVTARDERVRPTHVETDGQAVPANLRFQVPSTTGSGVDLAREPRDPSLPIGNRINCRCGVTSLPQALADSIHKGAVEVLGTRVRQEFYTEFPRAGESEVGNTSGDEAAHFMRAGLNEAAARFRDVAARGT